MSSNSEFLQIHLLIKMLLNKIPLKFEKCTKVFCLSLHYQKNIKDLYDYCIWKSVKGIKRNETKKTDIDNWKQ